MPSASYETSLNHAGRNSTHTFSDLRSATHAYNRTRTRNEKYYNFRGLTPHDLPSSDRQNKHYLPVCRLSDCPTSDTPDNCFWNTFPADLSTAPVSRPTKREAYNIAQQWPRPPRYHRSHRKNWPWYRARKQAIRLAKRECRESWEEDWSDAEAGNDDGIRMADWVDELSLPYCTICGIQKEEHIGYIPDDGGAPETWSWEDRGGLVRLDENLRRGKMSYAEIVEGNSEGDDHWVLDATEDWNIDLTQWTCTWGSERGCDWTGGSGWDWAPEPERDSAYGSSDEADSDHLDVDWDFVVDSEDGWSEIGDTAWEDNTSVVQW